MSQPAGPDAPATSANPRSRSAGAGMARTREAALGGARRVVTELGVRRAAMADIAIRAGMAKATLYNHFRTKDDVVAALVLHEASAIVDESRALADDPAKSLARVAWRLMTHPALRGALAAEPTLAVDIIAAPVDRGPTWCALEDLVGDLLGSLGLPDDAGTRDLVARWLMTCALVPVHDGLAASTILDHARAVVSGLPAAPAGSAGTSTSSAPVAASPSSPT